METQPAPLIPGSEFSKVSTPQGGGHLLRGAGRQHRRETGQAAAEAGSPASSPPSRRESLSVRGGGGGGGGVGAGGGGGDGASGHRPRESAATIAMLEKRHVENRRHIGSSQLQRK